jgi:hypothetical protein
MSRSWKKLDLRGAGLQALNLHLAQHLKRRRTAYLLWLLFPLGAHRVYLEERIGSVVYPALTAIALMLWLAFGSALALVPLAAALAFALYDLYWIDRRLTAINKQIRMELYLQGGNAPPPGYRGRYPEEDPLEDYLRVKERERPGLQPPDGEPKPPPRRVPSLAEQEALLREMARRRETKKD